MEHGECNFQNDTTLEILVQLIIALEEGNYILPFNHSFLKKNQARVKIR